MAVRILLIGVVVATQLIAFPMPAGTFLEGVVLDLLGALMAVGLELVYRLNQIVNFAQGDLGAEPLCLPSASSPRRLVRRELHPRTCDGLASVAVLTCVVEVFILRRFARSGFKFARATPTCSTCPNCRPRLRRVPSATIPLFGLNEAVT